jgi:hypothetical protein
MRKLFLLLILSFFSFQSFAGSCPDGSEPVKSVSADGTYYVYNCGGGNEQSSSSTANSSNANSNTKALAGIDIENDPNIEFFKPPQRPETIIDKYWGGLQWKIADFNNDGHSDVLYAGAMNVENVADNWKELESFSNLCGGGACKGKKPLPSLLLGDAKKQLTYSPELIIDNREDSGLYAGRQILVADYNNDKVLDFYVADHGIGTDALPGARDSYFLSQPNGTWIESSETHLNDSNLVLFDHGGATGDIDNDGDMDVVITGGNEYKGGAFWCWMNDGTGFLTKRQCGGILAFGLELGDMDGDGDLDALLGAHEFDKNIDFTGIVWNDGRGNFPKNNTTPLPQHKKKWGTIPEVSAADLDNDGDLDIVYSRAGWNYVGTAVQIIENLGHKKFKDHGIFPLVVPPADYIPTHEANEWNDYINAIRFRDLDKDGDLDLYFSNALSQKTNGMVLLNQGNFAFEILHPHGAAPNVISVATYEFYDLTIETKAPVSEEQKAEEQTLLDEFDEFEAQLEKELAAEAADAIAKRKAKVAAAKAKVAAAKAKRIAEEAAKSAETDTVDTEQSVEDEIAAFEAELEAELGD